MLILSRIFFFLLLAVLSLISLNQIVSISSLLFFQTSLLGYIGWLTAAFAVFFFSRSYFKKTVLIFLTFFCIGNFLGPYLEPPSDPLEHLRRTYYFCDRDIGQVQRGYPGVWQYSMSGNVLCSNEVTDRPETIMRKIGFLHGIYWGLLTAVLFILAKSLGLPDRWSFLSVVIAFLFFGTNRFSYFSYYSLAPSFTSLAACWLWTAAFFNKSGWKEIFNGTFIGLIVIPIIWVNHQQESVLLVFVISVWLFLNIHGHIWKGIKNIYQFRWLVKALYIFTLFTTVFLIPQLDVFQNIFLKISVSNYWTENQPLVVVWNKFHLIGKVWDYRVRDTLGLLGFLPLAFCLLIFVPGFTDKKTEIGIRVVVLGSLPFIGYLLPLPHFIWASNVKQNVYYRLCYISMFWISISYFLYIVETRCVNFLQAHVSPGLKNIFPSFLNKTGLVFRNTNILGLITSHFRAGFFSIILILFILLSSMRSDPVYGKLNFLLIENRPWWYEWRPILQEIVGRNRKIINTDSVTGSVLHGVFNQPVTLFRKLGRESIINIRNVNDANANHEFLCLINLHGFTPSWVPFETGHWYGNQANTSLHYRFDKKQGIELLAQLKIKPLENCMIYY
jgi:hypothetical protein